MRALAFVVAFVVVAFVVVMLLFGPGYSTGQELVIPQ